MPFYANAKVVTLTSGGTREQCADPRTVVAGSCCVITEDSQGLCEHNGERMTYSMARARCDAKLGSVCADTSERVNNCGYKSSWIRHWTSSPCTIRAQVSSSGWVNVVHAPFGKRENRRPSFAADNANVFRVSWRDALFPTVANNCSAACEILGDTCLCDVRVEETRIFDALPTASQVEASCKLGSFCPHSYDEGIYVLIGQSSEVSAYARADNFGGGGFNEHTVFYLASSAKCYANRLSLVHVEGTQLAFRNSPHFVSFLQPTSIDAEQETEALLDHLFHHPNVAPFVAHRLIQRFTTSNPSPRYVGTVATAFSAGAFGGVTYSGQYGDLSATIAAVLLDREARSATLDADPTHGQLREPLLKLHHVLRSMEFVSRDDREIEMPGLEMDIGMEAHKSPSVFNFYTHDYQPSGPVAATTLVSPEAGLATAPYLIGFLNGEPLESCSPPIRIYFPIPHPNPIRTPHDCSISVPIPGMTELIGGGLSSCRGGFGRECANWKLRSNYPDYEWSDGRLSFKPTGSTATDIVAELDTLLTGGRLNANATAVIVQAYKAKLATSSAREALVMTQQLFIAAAEFHATNMHTLSA
jgi:hypothetical protein